MSGAHVYLAELLS